MAEPEGERLVLLAINCVERWYVVLLRACLLHLPIGMTVLFGLILILSIEW